MIRRGDIISYLDMCREEGVSLQRGMNFRMRDGISVILMSLRSNAPYADRVEDDGRILLYEGHDVPRRAGGPDPKSVDQSECNPSGTLTQNGLFYHAARKYRQSGGSPERVRVYEKIRDGIWAYNGVFELADAWREPNNGRQVFKFKLQLLPDEWAADHTSSDDIDHDRIIPTWVKLEVWKRDKGRCVLCMSTDNLHFDHIIPYSKGGSSLIPENIQLLCARHNLLKRDRIE